MEWPERQRRRPHPRATGVRIQQQGREVWPFLSCLPGAGQQVGSYRPGQEKQGERETDSQKATLPLMARPVYHRHGLCLLHHCLVQRNSGTQGGQPLAKFTQPVGTDGKMGKGREKGGSIFTD